MTSLTIHINEETETRLRKASEEMDKVDFVEVEAKTLSSALRLANAIVEVRNTAPILNDVRLTYGRTGLIIEATDLDIHATMNVDEIDGYGAWSLCIPARYLAAVAGAAGTGIVRIEPVSSAAAPEKTGAVTLMHGASITAGLAAYSIQTIDPADFPMIAGDRAGLVERFTNGHFATAFRKVSGCISTEETRYYLNGINWAATDKGRHMAATDGHRLALCRYAASEDDTRFSYIIPRKAVGVISQFLASADVEIFAVAKGNQIIDTVLDIKAPGIVLRCKLIDGTYPDIERVMPKEQRHAVEIRTEEMLSAIRQATAIGAWRGSAIRLHGVAGRLNVEVRNAGLGMAKVSTSSAWPEGLDEIGVNSRYMADMVKRCQGSITLRIIDKGHPITLADQDPDMIRLVMPMRT